MRISFCGPGRCRRWGDFGLLALFGLIAGIGFYCLSQAYSVAAPSLVAPFEYASLPWALLWGYVFWGDLPGPATILGILLVVASGLYIIRREIKLAAAKGKEERTPSEP